jgi:hypothetical protein
MSDGPHDPGEDRLLPGEASSMSSGDLEHIRQWVATYSELYSFKENLLQEIDEQVKQVTPPGGFELANDKRLLESEASRIHKRLQFWQHRLEESGGA